MPLGETCSCGPVLVVELANRYYGNDDESVLPRSIATKDAFTNAMALDVAMGGSTNTVLHLLAAAMRARSTSTSPTSTHLAPGAMPVEGRADHPAYHMEDVHRAGGIPRILGELDRGGLLERDVHTVHSPDLQPGSAWDIRAASRALRR